MLLRCNFQTHQRQIVTAAMSLVGFCEEADPTRHPQMYRPTSVLKAQFLNSRSHFTSAKKKWELSGQNDP